MLEIQEMVRPDPGYCMRTPTGCMLPVEMFFPACEFPAPALEAALSGLGAVCRQLPREADFSASSSSPPHLQAPLPQRAAGDGNPTGEPARPRAPLLQRAQARVLSLVKGVEAEDPTGSENPTREPAPPRAPPPRKGVRQPQRADRAGDMRAVGAPAGGAAYGNPDGEPERGGDGGGFAMKVAALLLSSFEEVGWPLMQLDR